MNDCNAMNLVYRTTRFCMMLLGSRVKVSHVYFLSIVNDLKFKIQFGIGVKMVVNFAKHLI